MVILAARAALAAAVIREALALHTTRRSEPLKSEPQTLGATFQEGHGWRLSRKKTCQGQDCAVTDEMILDDLSPHDVQAELDDRRRKLERLEQDVAPAAVDAHRTDSKTRRQTEQSVWLSGKSRQAMTNYNDVQYVSFLELGGQTISGILDTGSFELVVFSKVCDSCGQAARYDPTLSVNYTQGKLANVQSYGSGDTFSVEAWDMVSIGPYPPKLQPFWEVTSAKMPVLKYSAFQSIIGIGPPETPVKDADEAVQMVMENISNWNKSKWLPDDLKSELEKKQKVLESVRAKSMMVDTFGVNMFSVCLGKKPGSDGYLIWSDTAPLVKPEYFVRVPVVGNHTWSVKLDKPRFAHGPSSSSNKFEGVKLGCENGCGALLDSGTSLMAMPGDTINELVRVTLEPGFNCSNLQDLPSIKLRLGDHEIILPPDAYIADVVDANVPEYLQSFVRMRKLRDSAHQSPGGHCDLMVMESGASTAHGPLWILGVPFFRQFYTTFEVGGHSKERRAVHLARASDTCTPSAPGDFQNFVPPTQLYRRLIHPAKLWVPPSVHSALGADYVNL